MLSLTLTRRNSWPLMARSELETISLLSIPKISFCASDLPFDVLARSQFSDLDQERSEVQADHRSVQRDAS